MPGEEASSAPRLWNRNFVLLWQGQLVSQLGNQAFAIAMMYWLMEATGSASLMGTVMMVSTLPGVFLSPVGGAIVDRHPGVRLIVLSDVLRGVMALGLFAVFALRPESTGLIVGFLFVIAVVGGIVSAVFVPAITAAIPDLVPPARLAAANSLNEFSVQGVVFIGQAVGGVLYRILGAPILFLIDGVSFLLSAVSESFIRLPARKRETASDTSSPRAVFASYAHDTTEGIRYVWTRSGMRAFLVLAAGVNLFIMPVVVLLPFFVSQQLDAGPEWYGFLLAMLGAGAIIGYAIAGGLPIPTQRRPALIVAAFFVIAVAIALLGQIRTPLVALATFAIVGVGSGLINIFVLTLFQRASTAEMRGRVMGLVMTVSGAATPIGLGLGGLIGDLTGKNIPVIFGTCGAAMAVLTAIAMTRSSFRSFLATEITGVPTS